MAEMYQTESSFSFRPLLAKLLEKGYYQHTIFPWTSTHACAPGCSSAVLIWSSFHSPVQGDIEANTTWTPHSLA